MLNLQKTMGATISVAYEQATSEFVKLRAKHEMASMAAELEARHYGAEFLKDPFVRRNDLGPTTYTG